MWSWPGPKLCTASPESNSSSRESAKSERSSSAHSPEPFSHWQFAGFLFLAYPFNRPKPTWCWAYSSQPSWPASISPLESGSCASPGQKSGRTSTQPQETICCSVCLRCVSYHLQSGMQTARRHLLQRPNHSLKRSENSKPQWPGSPRKRTLSKSVQYDTHVPSPLCGKAIASIYIRVFSESLLMTIDKPKQIWIFSFHIFWRFLLFFLLLEIVFGLLFLDKNTLHRFDFLFKSMSLFLSIAWIGPSRLARFFSRDNHADVIEGEFFSLTMKVCMYWIVAGLAIKGSIGIFSKSLEEMVTFWDIFLDYFSLLLSLFFVGKSLDSNKASRVD